MRALEWWVIVALLLVVAGCAPPPRTRLLEHWTLTTSPAEAGTPVTLPRHVDRLVDRAPSFVLRTRVHQIADFGVSGVAPTSPTPVLDRLPTPTVRARTGSDPPTVDDAPPRRRSDSGLTHTGELLGTPPYMAPEIVPRGVKAARPPADVFAFGVIAFELLAGRRPFADLPTFVGVSMRQPVPSFAAICPSRGPATARLLFACLSVEPRARPTSAQLADALSNRAPPASAAG